MNKDALIALLKRSPIVVACAVLSLALIAVWYFRSDKIPEAQKLLDEKGNEADRYALNRKNATHLKEDLDALIAANKAIDAHILRASRLSDNVQYLYRLENETGVKLLDPRQTTPGTVAKPAKGSFVPVAFNVSMEGTLPQLLDYLRRIESGEHYGRILTASCNANISKRSAPLTLTVTFELLGTP